MNTLKSSWLKLNWLMLLGCLALGWVYVSQAWSPSSYGHVLEQAGAEDTGLVWGQARAIRSDEWSVTTPLTQAAVRNGFTRFNTSSFYQEDLRINYSLPIHDWGLAFKPSMWLYGWLPPAHAYSFHYWLMFSLFVFGYAHFFNGIGCSAAASFLLAVSLYFTGFVQFFWNSNTSLLTFFPWLLVVIFSSVRPWLKGILFYWLACCWLIGNFYPPLFISLTIVACVVIWAYRPDLLKPRPLSVVVIAGLAACGTSVLYLWDYLFQTWSTSYPGQRTSVAGYYPWHVFWTQLFPTGLIDLDFRPGVTYTNITGVGVVGLYWTLAVIFFLNWSPQHVQVLWKDRQWRILSVGILITSGWMLAPVPQWLGHLTLLNRVPPERMVYAAGLMLLIWMLHVWRRIEIAKDHLALRFLLYGLMVLLGSITYSSWTQDTPGFEYAWADGLGPASVALSLIMGRFMGWSTGTALLVGCLAANIGVFARFNPIQSAHSIFAEPEHRLAQTLRQHVNAEGVLGVQRDGLIGATLNGMGFRAVSHLNAIPPWRVWEELLGPLDAESKTTLNRYAHVRLVADNSVQLLENDQVGLPAGLFRHSPGISVSTQPPPHQEGGGQVERVYTQGDTLILEGWSEWNGLAREKEMLLVFPSWFSTEINPMVFDAERWDRVTGVKDAHHLLSGFKLKMDLTDPLLKSNLPCLYIRSSPSEPWLSLSTPWTKTACSSRSVK